MVIAAAIIHYMVGSGQKKPIPVIGIGAVFTINFNFKERNFSNFFGLETAIHVVLSR